MIVHWGMCRLDKEVKELMEIIKPELGKLGVYHASDLVLTMTRHPEFEETARFSPREWSPERVDGEITFIDGKKYRMTVEVIK